ncbi:MAG TPA: hypothetical protein VFK10_16000, partial [Burkholderiaceae bacterium]|nr:hypothetical protein [Burkholderiaceae bacterium]
MLLTLTAIACAVVGGLWATPAWFRATACDHFPLPNQFNGSGLVLSGETVACTTIGTTVVTNLYLNSQADSVDARTLVLSYAGAEDPTVQWVSPTELSIAVSQVSHVERRVPEVAGVKITYSFTRNGLPV